MADSQHIIVASVGFFESTRDLPKETRARVLKALGLLANDYRHPGLQTKKVKGSAATVFECRVDDSVRLIYDIDGRHIRCWYVGRHDVALRLATEYSQIGTTVEVDDIEIDAEPGLNDVMMFLNDGTVAPDFHDLDLQHIDSPTSSN